MLGLAQARVAGFIGAALCCAGAAGAEEAFSFRSAAPGYHFSFPRDHFAHPAFKSEWWYYTGNVSDAGGRRFGFELVFFREGVRRGPSASTSAWRIEDLYLAHLALTDIDGRRFYHHQRLNRAGPGVAGASLEQHRVWNGNWSADVDGPRAVLEATTEEFHFRMQLDAVKPPVINGVDSISQKADGPGHASYYVSIPLLNVSGDLELNGVRHRVHGTAWMDHEWFTHQLGTGQTGWDWFSIQLEDGTELMLFQLRRDDRTIDPHSAGTFIARDGHAVHLSRTAFSLTPAGNWKSPATGTVYPVRWTIRVPALELTLEAQAALESQELPPAVQGSPAYWEGAVTYSGSAKGVGYLEMTGYDKPVRIE